MKFLIFLISFPFFLFLYSSQIQANEILFEDNFNISKKPDWEEYIGHGGSWTIENGEYVGTVVKDCSGDYPSYSLAGNINWTDYSFEVRIKGTQGVDKKILFRYKSHMKEMYDLNLVSSNVLAVAKYHPSGGWMKIIPFSNSSNVWYSIKVALKNENIKIYIDNILKFDYNDTDNPILNGKIGLQVWPGYYAGCGGRTTVRYDDIVVKSLTPPLQPLILLPGLGASWNHESMILGQEKPQTEWYMTPGVKVYDGLIETLKNAGYKTEGPDKNLFIFNYNWTKPVDSITNELKNYIDNVVDPPEGTKIDLVGHSLGGLVARTYVQNNPNNPVDQLITLGSPHKGAPQVYYLWEGGDLNKTLPGWQRIAAGLLLHLRKPGFSTPMEAVRSVIPGLKDLLPTFNYLKQNSTEIPLNSMNQQNDWLINLNSSPPAHLLSILNTFVGLIPNSTLRWINIENPSWLDNILGLWKDGKPTGEEKAGGDGTVLSESGSLQGVVVTNLENLNHRDLIESTPGQQKIMEILGLSPPVISTISAGISYEPALAFQLASPATISAILGPDGNPVGFTDGKLAVIPGATAGEYQVKITGTDSGNYHLYIGQILPNQDFWTTTSDSINLNEGKIYKINFNPSTPTEDPVIDQTGESHLKSSQNKLLELKDYLAQQNIPKPTKRTLLSHLNHLVRLLNKGKIEDSIISLYRLRHQLNLWSMSGKLNEQDNRYLKNKIQEIIEDLEQVYIIIETNKGGTYNPTKLAQEINLAQRDFNRMENKLKSLANQGKTKPDYGILYSLALEKLNQAKSSSSYKAHINTLGARFLSQEGLFFFK